MIRDGYLPPSADRFNVNTRERVASVERDKPDPPPATHFEVAGGNATASATNEATNPYPLKTACTLIEATAAVTTAIGAAIVLDINRNGTSAGTLTIPAGSTIGHDTTFTIPFSDGTIDTVSVSVNNDGGGGYGAWSIKLWFRA